MCSGFGFYLRIDSLEYIVQRENGKHYHILNLQEISVVGASNKGYGPITPMYSKMSSEASGAPVEYCHDMDNGNQRFCSSDIECADDPEPWLVFGYPAYPNFEIRKIQVYNRVSDKYDKYDKYGKKGDKHNKPGKGGKKGDKYSDKYIVGATIVISRDKDGKNVLWEGRFQKRQDVYTWDCKVSIDAGMPLIRINLHMCVTTSGSKHYVLY